MSDALPLEPKSQFKNWREQRPIKELDDRGLNMVEAMTFGVDESEAAELANYYRDERAERTRKHPVISDRAFVQT